MYDEDKNARPAMEDRSKQRVSPLAEVELRILEEGREWTRRRLQEELQKLADSQGAFPPSGAEGSRLRQTADDPLGNGGG